MLLANFKVKIWNKAQKIRQIQKTYNFDRNAACLDLLAQEIGVYKRNQIGAEKIT